ncbi:YcbX family protein [Providencia alcalifaciens]|uniref:YcbX family protein n=1 Tax=Providencia alcalifaciens TaxID=126385 RepID=UPI0032DB2D1B
MITLSRLYTHPVKSMRGVRLSHAFADTSGLTFDRNFMVTTLEGKFITARKYPQMLLFTPVMLNNGLHLQAPNGESATVLYQDFDDKQSPTEVWGNHFHALIAPQQVNSWLSTFFDEPVQLRWLSTQLSRRVKNHQDVPVSFADGYPFLLINEASVQELQGRCPASIKLEQFRGNLIITGAKPFEEDTWKTIQIGDVIFTLDKPCSRCILTTVSPEKGIKHPNSEPLATLQTFRTDENGDVDFGQNVMAKNTGIIRVGDMLTVLETKPAKQYITQKREVESPSPSPSPSLNSTVDNVSLIFEETEYQGDNQNVVLEQLESHGLSIPYSCRAGICGRCKIKLISGEVTPLKQSAIKENGYILSCSCIPKTSLKLALN